MCLLYQYILLCVARGRQLCYVNISCVFLCWPDFEWVLFSSYFFHFGCYGHFYNFFIRLKSKWLATPLSLTFSFFLGLLCISHVVRQVLLTAVESFFGGEGAVTSFFVLQLSRFLRKKNILHTVRCRTTLLVQKEFLFLSNYLAVIQLNKWDQSIWFGNYTEKTSIKWDFWEQTRLGQCAQQKYQTQNFFFLFAEQWQILHICLCILSQRP